jgi:hypothetical protein
MGKRYAIVIGLAAAGVMALGAQTAAADVVKHDTELTRIIQDGGGNLHGSVKSEAKWCEGARRVILFKVRPGPDRRLGPARISHHIGAHHGSTGAIWNSWVAPRAHGWQVYAEVRRKVRHRLVCLPDRSPIYRVS